MNDQVNGHVNDAVKVLNLLSAGAARQAVQDMTPAFESEHGVRLVAQFGAVGAMAEKFLAAEPCDVLITSEAMRARLRGSGDIASTEFTLLGTVRTATAVRAGDPHPDTSSEASLREAFLNSDAIYCPDVKRATAGLHLMSVLERLGIRDVVSSRICSYPNGAIAMAEMSQGADRTPLGCTQETEIIYTPEVELIGPLPEPFGLSTDYGAVVADHASEEAFAFIDFLGSDAATSALNKAGFHQE